MDRPAEEYRGELLNRLTSPRYCVKYLRAAIRDSKEAFLVALRNVVDAQTGMTKAATDAGLHRVNLYRMLSEEGNPRLDSLSSVLGAIGMRLSVEAIDSTNDTSPTKQEPAISAVALTPSIVGGSSTDSNLKGSSAPNRKGMGTAVGIQPPPPLYGSSVSVNHVN